MNQSFPFGFPAGRQAWSWILSIWIVAVGQVDAGLFVPAPGVRELSREADAIYTGVALRTSEQHPTTVRAERFRVTGNDIKGFVKSFTFSVDRVLQGPTNASITVQYFEPSGSVPGFTDLQLGNRYLMFLRMQDAHAHTYSPLDPEAGVFALPFAAIKQLKENPSLLDLLAAELLGAAENSRSEMAAPAMKALIGMHYSGEEYLATLRNVTLNADQDMAFLSIAARIWGGDLLALDDLRMLTEFENVPPVARLEILRSIEQGSRPSSVRSLVALSRVRDVWVRRAASYALRIANTGDRPGILAPLLDDSDPDVQYNALMGLYDVSDKAAHRGYAPAKQLYLDDPQTYLAHWKEWREQNRELLRATP
jgi:hypothetical protein